MPEKVEDFLHELHEKSYEREIDESESVWRSLPLFTVAFGFAVSLLGYLAGQTPPLQLAMWPLLAPILVVLPALAFAWAFRWFWNVIRPRTYRYLAPDVRIRGYAEQLRAFLAHKRATPASMEKSLLEELKAYISKELAQAATHNQKHNQIKAHARSQVAFWLTVGFGLAFVSTVLTFGHNKVYPARPPQGNDRASAKHDAGAGKNPIAGASSGSPGAASAPVYRGRGGSALPGQPTSMSGKDSTPPPSKAPAQPARPVAPPPTLVVKTGNEATGKKAH